MKVLILLAICLVGFTWAVTGADAKKCKHRKPKHPSSRRNTDQVVCYYTNWAIYRSAPAKFQPSNVDPSLCTIINYAFVGIHGNGSLRVLDSWADFDLNQIADVTALKQNNTNLKVVISMGGWNEGSEYYSFVVADPELRQVLVESVVDFVGRYGFDGFDLDWEYPVRRGGIPADRENYVTLLKELRAALKAANKSYILTAAVLGAGSQEISEIYNASAISKYLDYINLMLYDFHTPSEANYTFQAASVNASTISSEFQSEANQELSVVRGIEAWISQGAAPHKINLGIPFYGHSWTLANSSNNGLFAPATGPGPAGNLTATAGFYSYQEICLYHSSSNYTTVRDAEVVSPYRYSGNLWISYDDPESVAFKTNLAKQYGLAGVMVWDLDYDDFNNACNNGQYPLLNAINNALK